jgi:integrase
MTFPTKSDADAYLATIQADMVRKAWRAPSRVTDTVGEFGERWVQQRAGLKASTRRQYELDFRCHIEPYLGHLRLDAVTPAEVRQWRAQLGDDLTAKLAAETRSSTATARTGASTQARSYRLLRAIMATAVDDEVLTRNPCNIRNGGTYVCAERPTLTAAEVEALSAAVVPRYRVLVLLAAYSGLRLGEICELRRRDLDLEQGSVAVRRTSYHVAGVHRVEVPKSKAGNRDVLLPGFLVTELDAHLQSQVRCEPDALVFTTLTGRAANFGAPAAISKGLRAIGRADVVPHDLRHTAGTLRAQSGATIRDLMQTIGHSTPDAAMRYQHASTDHQRIVATRLNDLRQRTVG